MSRRTKVEQSQSIPRYTFTTDDGHIVFETNQSDLEKVKVGKTRGRTSKDPKQIINPIYAEMKKYTEDPYWLNKLDDWSYGKGSAQKFTIHGNNIRFVKILTNNKTNNTRITLDPNNLEYSLNLFKKFLEDSEGIISDLDRKERSLIEAQLHHESLKSNDGKMNKNILNIVKNRIKLIDAFIVDFLSKNDEGNQEAVIQSIKDAIKLIILSKNHKLIVLNQDNTEILEVKGLKKDNRGMYYCEISAIKSNKNTKNANQFFEQDSDDEEENTRNLGSKASFEANLSKFLLKK